MCKAIVKKILCSYKKKDGSFGSRVNLELSSGESVVLFCNVHNEVTLKTLKLGQAIDLKKEGNFWNVKSLVPPIETTEDVFNSMENNSNQQGGKPVDKFAFIDYEADKIIRCYKAIEERYPSLPDLTKSSMAISMYIKVK